MTSRAALLLAAVALGSGGCSDALFAGEPGSCNVGLNDFQVHPSDGAVGVSVDTVIRVLAPAGGDGLLATLTHGESQVASSLSPSSVTTEYGAVLDLAPPAPLDEDTLYFLTVSDAEGTSLYDGLFWTGPSDAEDATMGSWEPLAVQTIAASQRNCCSGTCVDGTWLSIPTPQLSHFPQLVVVEVRELYNSNCGASSRSEAILPAVVEDGQPWVAVETNEVLVGCFTATLTEQTGQTLAVIGEGCTQGVEWDPLASDPDCLEVGCAGGPGLPSPLDAAASAGLALWWWTRSRPSRQLWRRQRG